MTPQKFFYLFAIFFHLKSEASPLSVPEACFEKQISPCLIKVEQTLTLKLANLKTEFHFNENSIAKWIKFGAEPEIEILQGGVHIVKDNAELQVFKLNQVRFTTAEVFALREDKKLKVYDLKNFILSEYDLLAKKDQSFNENVIVKADFLSKEEMISFTAKFFQDKKLVKDFLKKIEKTWQQEFKTQTESQTKVLQRSVASIEAADEQRKRRAREQREEAKKVRELFFYRTFYR